MEQRDKVKLTITTTFDLEHDEIRRLYVYLSLFQYRYLRVPHYREDLLLETLEKDFRKYLVELQVQCEKEPNNLMLSKIRPFFDLHYGKLKCITAQRVKQEEYNLTTDKEV